MSIMIAAITGANGFIGTHLRNALNKQGVTTVSIPHDILQDCEKLTKHMLYVNPNYIFHLSAYGNMSHQQEPDKIIQANIIGTWNLLCATQDIPYKALINVSTSSVLLPHETFYSATKSSAERLGKAFATYYNKPVVSVRPFSVYGPGEADFRFIPTVFRSCMTGEPMTLAPDAVHDWVYVEDFVQYLIKAAHAVEMSELFDVHDFGSGIKTSNQEIVNLIEKITNKKANITERKELRAFDSAQWCAEYNDTTTTLEEGLQLIHQHYTMNSERG